MIDAAVLLPWRPVAEEVPAKLLPLLLPAATGRSAILSLLKSKGFLLGLPRYVLDFYLFLDGFSVVSLVWEIVHVLGAIAV